MRFWSLPTCCAMWLTTATALAIPPREPVKSYKSFGQVRPSAMDATPSFSPAAQLKGSKSPGAPTGASGRSMSGLRIPGSMAPRPADYYSAEDVKRNHQQNYGPIYQQRYGPNYQQNYGRNFQQNYGQNYQQNSRPYGRPDYRPSDNRPNVVINRPQTNINSTTIINQTINNRPGYGYDASV